jgi:RimJ/RimL family protein N-acetyltransferase
MGDSQRTDPQDTPSVPLPSAVVLARLRHVSPVLEGARATLREPRRSDAEALLSALSTAEVARFISPPPDTLEKFEQFILTAREQRLAGQGACLAVLPSGFSRPVGLFQVRRMDPAFGVVEWAFALSTEFWGEGLFYAAAPLLIDWVFETLGAGRLEARSAVTNGRGNGALRKLGAVQEAVLRKALLCNGEYVDQVLWTLTAECWRALRPSPRIHVH